MARTPCIPPELTKGPFTLEEARAAGLTLSALTSKAWRRLGAELYCLAQLKEDPWQLLSAWQRSLPAEAVFAGGTAAWLFGLDVEPIDPVEIVVPPESGIRPRVGLTVRRQNLLINAGFRLLRFTATDVYNRPEVVEAQVRGALVSGSFRVERKASSPRSRRHRASAPGPRHW